MCDSRKQLGMPMKNVMYEANFMKFVTRKKLDCLPLATMHLTRNKDADAERCRRSNPHVCGFMLMQLAME